LTGIIFCFESCRNKIEYYEESQVELEFSTDTVSFDTVFSSIGSTTKQFLVFNPYDKTVNIPELGLARGTSSPFRINVNGAKGAFHTDVEIPPKDSIFIFVEVTIDPGIDNLVEKDSVVFQFDGNQQDIKLIAYGQDVNLVKQEIISSDTCWTNTKPYLIYDYVFVDTNATLCIEEGVQIFLHDNTAVYVLGTIESKGTVDNPVIFTGDRLEDDYMDIPGQWGYIHLLAGSRNNYFENTVIKNGIIGIRADTLVNSYPTLQMHNCRIENMNAVGLYALGARVFATNCVFANCGQATTYLSIGGYYEFYNCTMSNRWFWSNRNTPSVILNNYYQDVNGNINIRSLIKADFKNCIIDGSLQSEVAFDAWEGYPEAFNYKFDHCLLKIDSTMDMPDENFNSIYMNLDPGFVSSEEYNYELDSLSEAINKGSLEFVNEYPTLLQNDILGNIRDDLPDLGAFERID
jgi:hypothetical protein